MEKKLETTAPTDARESYDPVAVIAVLIVLIGLLIIDWQAALAFTLMVLAYLRLTKPYREIRK